MKSLVGKTLHETYRVEEKLGAGGMGVVYRAAHLRLRRSFAIKVLRSAVDEDDESFARFRREAELTSELGHPHIVQVVDFNQTEDGDPYIVMELLEGESLAARLKRSKRLPLERALKIAEQVGSALGAAHSRGIVHRDLKPHNVYLCPQEDGGDFVKVLDFGISKVQGGTSVVTQSKAVVGTPMYMAPEQARGESRDVDGRADQFALAAMLYEMLAGQSPFIADSVPTVLYRVVHHDPRSLSDVAEAVPEEVASVVMRALSKDRDARYPSIAAFLAALRGEPLPEKTGGVSTDSTLQASELEATPSAVALAATRTAMAAHEPQGGTLTDGDNARPAPEKPGTITGGTSSATVDSPRSPWRFRSLLFAATTAVAVAAGTGAWVLMANRDRAPVSASGDAPADAREAPDTAQLTSPPSPAADAAPATVELRFEVSPPPDRILVDGVEIEGGRVVLARDGSTHQVRVEKQGYETRTLALDSDRTRVIELGLDQLEKAAGKRPPTRPGKRATEPVAERETPTDEPAPPDGGRFITDF